MYGYKVNLKGLPENVFACSVEVNDYDWHNRNGKNTIEFSVSKAEKTTIIIGDETLCMEGISLSCVPGDEKRKAFCEPGIKKEITSIAVQFEKIDYTGCILTRENSADNSVFLLPAAIDKLPEISEISRLMNKYIKYSVSDSAYDKAMRISVWFELLCLIDKSVRRILSSHSVPNENYYVKKLDYIIEKNYSKNISLSMIAKEFGVSLSYLSWIYSNTTGHTVSEAILTRRMEKIKHLILTTSLSASEIAQETGFCDETYMRKKFKKFFGVNMSEFKSINKELTLYHDKPLRE